MPAFELGNHIECALDGRLSLQAFTETIRTEYEQKDSPEKRREFLYEIADWLAGIDDSTPAETPRRKNFLSITNALVNTAILPESLVKEVLDVATLEEVALVPDKVWRVETSRLRTTRVYTQQTYSLAVEDLEGFASLTGFLMNAFKGSRTEEFTDEELSKHILDGLSVIGVRHQILPIRVIASVLHAGSLFLERRWQTLLSVVENFKERDLENAAVFLFRHAFLQYETQQNDHHDITRRLSFMASLLSLHGKIQFRRVFYQLWSKKQEEQLLVSCAALGGVRLLRHEFSSYFQASPILGRLWCRIIYSSTQTLYQRLKQFFRRARNAGTGDGKQTTEKTATHEVQSKQAPNQKEDKVKDPGNKSESNRKSRPSPSLSTEENFFYPDWSAQMSPFESCEQFFDRFPELIEYVGLRGIAAYPILASRVARMAGTALKALASIAGTKKSSDIQNEDLGERSQWIELLLTYIVPVIGIHEPEGGGFLSEYPEDDKETWNAALCDDLWMSVKEFTFKERAKFYLKWNTIALSDEDELIASSRKQTIVDTGKAMRRLAKGTIATMGRNICRNAHRFPTVVFDYVLELVEMYENQRRDVVDAFRYLTPLCQDALATWLIVRLSNDEKKRLKDDQLNASNWIQSLAMFQSAFLKRNYEAEMRSILAYLKSRLLGNSVPDLVVFEELLKGMGGVDTGELTESQLEAVCGGSLLNNEEFGRQSTDNQGSKRLALALLQEPQLIPSLLILLAQQRQVIQSVARPTEPEQLEKYTEEHLKQLILTFDRAHDAFQHFADFLADHTDLGVYYDIVPDVKTLCREAGLDLEIAMLISRRKMQRMLRCHGTPEDLPKTLEQIKACAPEKRIWKSFTPRFYLLFWSLVVCDIATPTKRYEKVIDRLRAKQRALDDTSRARTSEYSDLSSRDRQRERKRVEESIRGLIKERDNQKTNEEGLANMMSDDKMFWLDRRTNSFCIAEDLVQYCFAPRAVLSVTDAIFCAQFLSKMHDIGVPSFATSQVVDMILTNMNYILGLSEQEAKNYGRFIGETLLFVNRWSLNEETYRKKALGNGKLPGMQRSSIPRTEESFEDRLIPWKGYRALCLKWSKCMATFFGQVLDARQNQFVRIVLLVMTQIVNVFPLVEEHGLLIDSKLTEMLAANAREDVKVMARSYIPKLKQRQSEWIPKEDFRAGLNKKREDRPAKRKAEETEPVRPTTRRRVGDKTDDSVFQRLGKKVSSSEMQPGTIPATEHAGKAKDSNGKPSQNENRASMRDKPHEEGEIAPSVTPTSAITEKPAMPLTKSKKQTAPQSNHQEGSNVGGVDIVISDSSQSSKKENPGNPSRKPERSSRSAKAKTNPESTADAAHTSAKPKAKVKPRSTESGHAGDGGEVGWASSLQDPSRPPRQVHPLPERPRDPPPSVRDRRDREGDRSAVRERSLPITSPQRPEKEVQGSRERELDRVRERDEDRAHERYVRDRETERERDKERERRDREREREREKEREQEVWERNRDNESRIEWEGQLERERERDRERNRERDREIQREREIWERDRTSEREHRDRERDQREQRDRERDHRDRERERARERERERERARDVEAERSRARDHRKRPPRPSSTGTNNDARQHETPREREGSRASFNGSGGLERPHDTERSEERSAAVRRERDRERERDRGQPIIIDSPRSVTAPEPNDIEYRRWEREHDYDRQHDERDRGRPAARGERHNMSSSVGNRRSAASDVSPKGSAVISPTQQLPNASRVQTESAFGSPHDMADATRREVPGRRGKRARGDAIEEESRKRARAESEQHQQRPRLKDADETIQRALGRGGERRRRQPR